MYVHRGVNAYLMENSFSTSITVEELAEGLFCWSYCIITILSWSYCIITILKGGGGDPKIIFVVFHQEGRKEGRKVRQVVSESGPISRGKTKPASLASPSTLTGKGDRATGGDQYFSQQPPDNGCQMGLIHGPASSSSFIVTFLPRS